jgi:hypothetical protein
MSPVTTYGLPAGVQVWSPVLPGWMVVDAAAGLAAAPRSATATIEDLTAPPDMATNMRRTETELAAKQRWRFSVFPTFGRV